MKSELIIAKDYQKIDGRNAHRSDIKRMTLGKPQKQENQIMEIAAMIWRENENGELFVSEELAIHQILDLMVLLSSTLVYFKEAYRMPLLHDPAKPIIDRVGLQGGVMPIEINTELEDVFNELSEFQSALGQLGELTGERLRVINRILKELELY